MPGLFGDGGGGAEALADVQFQKALEAGTEGVTNALSNFSQNTRGGLGKASNLTLLPPSVGGALSIAPSAPLSSSGLGDEIIKQAGIGKIAELLGIGGEEKTTDKKTSKTTTKTTLKDKSASPTQGTNKPVEEAEQSREEGRSPLEQLFLQLINGELDIKF